MALRDLARSAGLPAATAHRLLLVLRRRGFVRQEGEGGRYVLTLKLLDMSFRYLNGSELRLHAYPPLREYAGRTTARAFVSLPAGEVTYVWGGQDDAPAMYTAYGKPMPGHCSLFFAEGQQRRLSCARLCCGRRRHPIAGRRPPLRRRRRCRGVSVELCVRPGAGLPGPGSGARGGLHPRARRRAAARRARAGGVGPRTGDVRAARIPVGRCRAGAAHPAP